MKRIARSVVAPLGFKCAGVPCGIKTAKGAPDLGLILSEVPAVAAGMFTTNRVKAAPVLLDQERLRGRKMRGIVVNAGNANACTGARGLRDARKTTELAACHTGAKPEEFLVASTGIIGHPLPMPKVAAGVRAAAASLGRSTKHAAAVAHAIMTTDLVPKAVAIELKVAGKCVRIGGIAKGSGMISPHMATMLSFITTDAAVATPILRKALREVVEETFNRITVDGDCSTNDTVAILANGRAGNAPIRSGGRAYRSFTAGLLYVAGELARAIARDGEGATCMIEVKVTGARTQKEAEGVARRIANSPLVKTAVHGADPNWGRIVCAAGDAGVPVEPVRMRLRLNGFLLFAQGKPRAFRAPAVAASMKADTVTIHLDIGRGRGSATIWTCDLSEDYIAINAEYHT